MIVQIRNKANTLIEAAVATTDEIGYVTLTDKTWAINGIGQWMTTVDYRDIMRAKGSLVINPDIPNWTLDGEALETLQRHIVHAIHQRVWDMPTLNERFPSVVDWLTERYHVDFDMASHVVIHERATNHVHRYEGIHDVREALESFLVSQED